MTTTTSTEKRLTWAGFLVGIGLLVELLVSSWIHPLAFITFAVVACPLVFAGMLLFLWALVAASD